MKNLETMQREGQEKVYKDIIYWVMNPSAREAIFTPKEANDVIDQHTADTWKAAQEEILALKVSEPSEREYSTNPGSAYTTGFQEAVHSYRERIKNLTKQHD